LDLHAFQINLLVGGLSSINRKSENGTFVNLSPATQEYLKQACWQDNAKQL